MAVDSLGLKDIVRCFDWMSNLICRFDPPQNPWVLTLVGLMTFLSSLCLIQPIYDIIVYRYDTASLQKGLISRYFRSAPSMNCFVTTTFPIFF